MQYAGFVDGLPWVGNQLDLVHVVDDLCPTGAEIAQKSVGIFVLLEPDQIVVGRQLCGPLDFVQAERRTQPSVPFRVLVDEIDGGHRRPEDLLRGGVLDGFPIEAGAPVRFDVRVRTGTILGDVIEQRQRSGVGRTLL